MSSFNSRWLDYAPPSENVSGTPKNTTAKTCKSPEPVSAPALEVARNVGTEPRLPWQLERLVSAACGDVLPQGTVKLTSGLVPDLSRYVLGWGCSYLVGDRAEAERRLWEAHRAWKGVN